jgi:membrane protein
MAENPYQFDIENRPLFKWLSSRRAFLRARKLLRRVHPWGPKEMNLYDVLRYFFVGIVNGSVATRAAAISFRLFLAFFPAMIVLLSIVPYTPLSTEDVLSNLELLFPADAVELFEQTVTDLIDQRQGALLSVGFVLMLFYASSSVNAILTGFGESFHLQRRPDWVVFRLMSILLLLVLSLLLGVAVLLAGFAGEALVWAEGRGWLDAEALPWLSLARWMVSLALVYTSVNILYHAGNRERERRFTFSVGASMTTVLIVLFSLGFSYFIEQFNSYNRLYGSLGTLLVTLVWVNSNSSVLLLGFELDAAIHRARRRPGSGLPSTQ